MKRTALLSLFLLLFVSCKEDEPNVVSEEELLGWAKVIIPNGREAHTIAGSIDDTLLVTTMMTAYFTTDGGETWQESPDFGGTVFDVVERNDTVYALWATGQRNYVGPPFIADQNYASLANQYTTDYGSTWQWNTNQNYHDMISPVGIATSESGVTYRIKDIITPLNPDTTSYRTNYSTVEMYHQGSWQTIEFPFEYVLNNLHVDEDNRLYVSASTWQYVLDNQIQGPDESYPGLVYIYQEPVP
jgi:hypothetical protein